MKTVVKGKRKLTRREAWLRVAEGFEDPFQYNTGLCSAIAYLWGQRVITYRMCQLMGNQIYVLKNRLGKRYNWYIWPLSDKATRAKVARKFAREATRRASK